LEPRARGLDVLLVEDNPDHAELTLGALWEGNRLDDIFWVMEKVKGVKLSWVLINLLPGHNS